MALDNLKISDDRSQELAKKMKEVKILDESTSVDTTDLAKNAIASLDNTKLATFIEIQFKSGETWKPFAELTTDPMYVFTVQSALDALGYDALLTGGDETFGIDEVYGSRTKAAVKKFQEDAGLTGNDVDGFVGEKTFALLVEKLKSSKSTITTSSNNDGTEIVSNNKAVYDAKGKLLVDAYGNAVNYVSSISDIPVEKFETDEWGDNIYVINGYYVYGNSRVMDLKTKKMYNREDIEDVITTGNNLTNVNTPADTNTVLLRTEKVGESVMDVYMEEIKNKYTKDYLKKVVDASGNKIAKKYLDENIYSLDFTSDNPNILLTYIKRNNKGYEPNTYRLKINVNDYTQGSNHFESILVGLIESEGKQSYYDAQLDSQKIRGLSYSLNELFPDKKDDYGYKAYFSKFEKSRVLIDSDPLYTKINKDSSGKLSIMFNLDDNWLDENYNKSKKILLEDVLDQSGNISQTLFKDKLKSIIENIVQNNPQEFASA